MSDELRRRLARAAGDGDIDAFRHLGLLLMRDGKNVESAAAALLGFTSSAPEAFRAIRNNVLVKATVDVLNRERARWTSTQLRSIADARTLTDRTRSDLHALASRIEQQRYPEFFEDWAAVNEAIADSLTPKQRRILSSRSTSEPKASTSSSSPSLPSGPPSP